MDSRFRVALWAAVALPVLASGSAASGKGIDLEDRYARIQIDGQGFITSLTSRGRVREYCPKGHPSPVMSLSAAGREVDPVRAESVGHGKIRLSYPNGSAAIVKASAEDRYFRFQLLSLSNRAKVDSIVWGPVHTTISRTIGDLIGVVRDGSWAIGMLGLNDNTIAGPPVDGDCYGMGYIIHSPDPKKYPVPPPYKEGQRFNIGGNGVSDVAFYSHPEEYFQMIFGTGAKLEPAFGSTLAYHARDRRKPYTYLFSLLPGFPGSRPRHQISDPVDADYLGSAVALYACPDAEGLSTIGAIQVAEHLPHPMFDGKWVRDPSLLKPDIAWYGPHDRMIEYARALGLKSVQDEGQGEYYANPADLWLGPRVGFSDGRKLSYKEFLDQAPDIQYGLHTLCLFLQPGRCTDVTPNASPDLQTVLRTKLANDISATDTRLAVTDPSFLGEDGTWPMRDGSNTLRIGTELLTYTSIVKNELQGVKRGYDGTTAQAHRAGDELDKLQMNCYNGFVPDMRLIPAYADYYAKAMAENGMGYIDFDGLESTLYQNQGYYGVRVFFRRLFDTYAKLSGGKCPRVMGSCVFAGGWDYMSVCNVGGGNNMFDPIFNRWGIEGKDVRYGFSDSYFPPTFGIQDFHSNWTVYDVENLQAKAIGWGATYMLGLSQNVVEKSGEKDAIFKAFRIWGDARESGVFSPAVKNELADLTKKFHLEPTGPRSYRLVPITEVRLSGRAGAPFELVNAGADQPLKFSLRIVDAANGLVVSLPGGVTIDCRARADAGDYVMCDGHHAFLADANRREIADLLMSLPVRIPHGKAGISVGLAGSGSTGGRFDLTVWLAGKPQTIEAPK
ncbi:MAG TPA: hypothetical protein VMI31_05840 [Fimbriimonadaceae bacterium]|nr:hypothetical protein [Fimbriimonadaceae bacterium]